MHSSARLLLSRTSNAVAGSTALAGRRLSQQAAMTSGQRVPSARTSSGSLQGLSSRSLHTTVLRSNNDASTTTADHPQTQAPGLEHQGQQPAPETTQPKSIRNDIDPAKLEIISTQSPKQIPHSSTLQFGHTFTDHMLTIPWSHSTGWGNPVIRPYGPLNLDPSSTVLHYASTLFEGLKAYRDAESDKVTLFRPDKNMERMNRSAARLAFPTFTGEKLTELIKKLVALDKKWIPSEPGHSLYIRPTMIGTQAALGVGASTDVLLFVICSPVGPYYKTGFKPVSLLATTKDVRAWPGGTGGFKLGSNYAGGIVPQMSAGEEGYQQILWLFGNDHEVTEVGTMNLWMVVADEKGDWELITPPLEDIILPGVTRDSVLSLAKEHADSSKPFTIEGLPKSMKVSERKMTMPQLRELQKQGRLIEMFGSGTAAVVSPIKEIGYEGAKIPVPVGSDGLGDVARAMLREITGRQLGTIESDWTVVVD